ANPIGRVNISFDLNTSSGQRKLFQLPSPCKIAIADKEGAIKGNIILKNILYSLHPSILAASINSFGSPIAYCLKKNTATGATIIGSTTCIKGLMSCVSINN